MACLLKSRGSGSDARGVVVRLLAAPKDQVAILVAGRGNDRRDSSLRHREEAVRMVCRPDRVDCDLRVPVCSVLETDRAGEARSELAVHLALRGPGADRPPGDKVGDVLGRDHVEIFDAGRKPHLGDVEQEAAGDPEAMVDPV